MRNEKVLYRAMEERNMLHTVPRRKANWIGHILRRNCRLKHIIEGKIEGRMKGKKIRGRKRKQLLNALKERIRYWKLKYKLLVRIVWRIRFEEVMDPS